MKERYNGLFEKLTPKKTDDELLTEVLRKAEKPMKKNVKIGKLMVTPIAAVIGLLATAVTAGAIYTGISYLQKSEYGQITDVMDKISTFVYEDSTENVKMTVEEVLSDGQKTVMTVHYEALNDTGKEWLENAELASNPPGEYSLDISPDSFGSGTVGVREIKGYKTENDRYYSVALDQHGAASENINLRYCLDIGQKKTAEISTGNMTELKWYELKAKEHGTDLFTPKYISISDLTYTVYGMNHKVYEKEKDERGYSVHRITPQGYDCWEHIDFSFVLADGTVFETHPNACLGDINASEENMYTDLRICHGDYKTLINEGRDFEYRFPNQEIVGVNICGVTYELVPIE